MGFGRLFFWDSKLFRTSILGFAISVSLFVSTNVAEEFVDFTRDVQPIFRKHCIKCHGPEEQESNLRLDRRASLLRGGNLGEPSILPGKGNESFLVKVIAGRNSDLKMPPEGQQLTEDQIATLQAWIDQGAKMPAELSGDDKLRLDHWSFQPVAEVQPPIPQSSLVANGVDAFILGKLDAHQLEPSKPAERLTRIRRLYLVMHGLPPTREQIARFLADTSPDAWQHAVDNVLKSPRYGERWARHWLDLVRFGETHGFETNRERTHAWPYRDYVIRSLNDDKPYDEFVREQIAGDALGEPIGTGFLVGGPYDVVRGGGDLAAMQRMNELDDIINTTGTTFLGLTLGCARCHNHKFDPVTQTDYYAIQAVFAGVKHGDQFLQVPPAKQKKIVALDAEIAALTQKLKRFIPNARDTEPTAAATRPAVSATHNVETFKPHKAKYVRFTIERTSRSQPCIDELEVFSGDRNAALAADGAKATASGSLKGYDIHKLEHINDGKYGNSHSWICDQTTGWVQIELPEAVAIDRIVWARDREGHYADRLAVHYRIECAVKPDEWQLVASSKDRASFSPRPQKSNEPTYDFATSSSAEAEQGKRWLARIEAARKEKVNLENSSKAYVGNFSQPGATHRLYRGEPDQKREVVNPGAVAALTTLDLGSNAPEQRRRVALANWIADKDNPLTARVIVNRLWQHHFGAGLVDTPSDFGANGTRPTNPELLDWLARELMDNGWSLKQLHRLILMSNTWQQDSRPHAAGMATDGASRLLWRFPPRRLEAEAIRDSMLAVSGVLNVEMGGPGFSGFDVQAENVRHFFPKKRYGRKIGEE